MSKKTIKIRDFDPDFFGTEIGHEIRARREKEEKKELKKKPTVVKKKEPWDPITPDLGDGVKIDWKE